MGIADWGLTAQGFYCPTYDEVLTDKINSAKELFGDDICTENNTILGKFIRLEAAYDVRLFEEMEEVYYSISPATATGVSLDRDVSFARMTRNTAVAAVHKLKVYGTQDYVLKKGTLVKSANGIIFYTTSDCTLSENDEETQQYYSEVNVQAADAGTSGNVRSINSLVDVNNNITSIKYVERITEGVNTETDTALRNRYNDVVGGMGTNTGSSIVAELLKINGVHKVIIIDNPTDSGVIISSYLTVESGKYAVIVYADDELDEEIAKAIFRRKPFGIKQNGSTEIILKDESGESHSVLFSHARELECTITVSCKVGADFPADGVDRIKDNILNYVNNLDMGKALVYSKLYQQIYSVVGTAEITSLTLNDGESSIYPEKDEIIKIDTIEVTVEEEYADD